MAQDMQPSETERTTAPQTGSEPLDDDEGFHYYAGGEVKELEGTKVSPYFLGFIVLLAIGAVSYFIFGGALPQVHRYRPQYGSSANLNAIRSDLAARDQAVGTLSNIEMTKLPLPAGQSLDDAIQRGTDLYQTNCIGCHGPNQDGNGINAAGLNPKPRNLRDAPFIQSMSLDRINQSIHRGVPGTAMPRWENTLNDAEIQDLIAYVWSLTSPKAPAPSAASASPASAPATNTYVGGMQNNPTPTNVPVNGNPAAPQSTAPPSVSGANPATGGTTTIKTAPAGGNGSAPAAPAANTASPAAGGQPSSQTTGPGEQKVAPIPGPAPATEHGTLASPKAAAPAKKP